MTMNIENLNKIKTWLEAGAPHAVFDIHVGNSPLTDEGVCENTSYSTVEEYFDGQPVPSDCGSICCIAGAAYLMSKAPEGQLFPSITHQMRLEPSWSTTRDTALEYLGLPENNVFFGHDLFDSALAPDGCTPAQAAVAVQNVIDGKEPWI